MNFEKFDKCLHINNNISDSWKKTKTIFRDFINKWEDNFSEEKNQIKKVNWIEEAAKKTIKI